jgi:RHS repeat-associated protein
LWGETFGADGAWAADTPLRFPGQYHDRETGLNYNLQRYYDPSTGRYASADPINLLGGLSVHSYVLNPLTWLDPLGLHGYDDSYKAIAFTDRVNTLSGWGRHEPHFTRPTWNQMQQFHNQIGHPLTASSRDGGRFGRYFGMHAERQAAFLDPNSPISVTNPMCDDCQGFFTALAQHQGVPQYVSDPNFDFTFHPDGTMSATPRH